MIVGHDQLAHTNIKLDFSDSEHGHTHDHQHLALADESHDHQDAHSLIGHILAHMPANFLETPCLDIVKIAQATPLFFHVPLIPRYLEPPLPPPKVIHA